MIIIQDVNVPMGQEEYTRMNSAGTLMGKLKCGAAVMESPEQASSTAATAAIYCSIGDMDGASARSGPSGWQVPKDIDPEGRYIIIN